nr:hypothetical protein [Tanacetum cinerariifolium]
GPTTVKRKSGTAAADHESHHSLLFAPELLDFEDMIEVHRRRANRANKTGITSSYEVEHLVDTSSANFTTT